MAPAGQVNAEEGRALKLVVSIALLGILAVAIIEVLECVHRVQRAGGFRAWWRVAPQYPRPSVATDDPIKTD